MYLYFLGGKIVANVMLSQRLHVIRGSPNEIGHLYPHLELYSSQPRKE